MHLTAASLIAGLICSSIGAGYFMYGKRAERPVHLVCGALLALVPWFLTNVAALVVVGVVLMLAPFAAARWLGL